MWRCLFIMNNQRRVFLDGNSTTPMDSRVRDLRNRLEEEAFGNASSDNWAGRIAREVEEEGIQKIANALSAAAEEIVITSGVTEAINSGIAGYLNALPGSGPFHVISNYMEHTAVLRLLSWLERSGRIRLTLLKPNSYGEIHSQQISEVLGADTVLVTLIHGNNEIGALNDIDEAAKILKTH